MLSIVIVYMYQFSEVFLKKLQFLILWLNFYFLKFSFHKIPWLFPDHQMFHKIPDFYIFFPDFSFSSTIFPGSGHPGEDTTCKLCKKETEDLTHFMVRCPRMEEFRNQEIYRKWPTHQLRIRQLGYCIWWEDMGQRQWEW